MKTDTPRPVRLEDYRPPDYLIETVHLDVSLNPTHTRVRSRLKVRRNPKAGRAKAPLQLDGEQLELEELKLDGNKLAAGVYELAPGSLTLPKVPERPFVLEATTIINPEANKALQGLYVSRGIYCTQCEAQGFRRITYFLDRPDVLATFTTRIEAELEAASVLLSNGNPMERGTLARGRLHYAVWNDPFPKPSYLFALVGGNLVSIASTYTTKSGREVELRIYAEPGKEDRCGWAMESLKRAMRWDEERFGREYDLDKFNIVAVSDFNMGAMENKGLNIFNDKLILASPDTTTDAGFEAIEAVVGHEYFHNWTGDRITCRDWFQLCLKEGLTVFRDQEFSADVRSRPVQRIGDVRTLKAVQFPEDAGPLAHPVRPGRYIEINNFYTSTVYEKGAEVVRMIQTILGPEGFRKGMDLYFARHDGQAVTVEDFVQCFADATGRSFAQFWLWYTQAGTPELVCTLEYDPAAKTAELTVEQVLPPTPGQPRKKPLEIPLKLGLIGGNGEELDLELDGEGHVRDGVVLVDKPKQTFRFLRVPSKPVPSLLREFSAPVRLTVDHTDRELVFLMEHDSDLFNRWQASNELATRTLIRQVKARMAGKRSTAGTAYVKALRATIGDGTLEPAYIAELLRPPSEADIARDLEKNVDPDAIFRARRQLMRLMGSQLGPELEQIYARTADNGPFSPDAESAGRRTLRNTALTLLSARDRKADKARLRRHYESAPNMTEAAHALYLIARERGPACDKVLTHFYQRWKDDHIVIDTWFAAQVMAPFSSTLARTRALTRHPLYSPTAPNKVRAVVSTFAYGNQVQFNRKDGNGYDFVAEQVLSLDCFNPQIAARLLGAFRSWRCLEPVRRRHAKRVLKRIARRKGLSRDVFEIVGKMLDA